jgi:hypothetical protein
MAGILRVESAAHDRRMQSDSILLAASILFAVCVASWLLARGFKPAVRLNLRFAAMLLASLAVAAPVAQVGDVAALVVLPLAGTALTLAALARFARRAPPLTASLALAASLACGLGAVLTGAPLLAAFPAVLATLLIAGAALQDFAWVAALSGVTLLAGISAFVRDGAGTGLLLFAAASLLGLSRSALPVEQTREARLGRLVRQRR